jgi:hypothetical protein
MVGRLIAGLVILGVTAVASADAPASHVARVRLALDRIPKTPEDRASETRPLELDALATSIAAVSVKAPRSAVEWSSLLVAVGSHETNFAGRLLRGECRLERRECDATKGKDGKLYARARGWGQTHRNEKNADLWDIAETDIVAQTKLVDRQLRIAYWTCARSGVPWVRATLNAYFGVRCGADWPGLGKREATFNLVMRVAVVKGGAS